MSGAASQPDLYVANAPPGLAGAAGQTTEAAAGSDYAWTHSPMVEELFVVITAVALPLALVRWARRFGIIGAARKRGKPTWRM